MKTIIEIFIIAIIVHFAFSYRLGEINPFLWEADTRGFEIFIYMISVIMFYWAKALKKIM